MWGEAPLTSNLNYTGLACMLTSLSVSLIHCKHCCVCQLVFIKETWWWWRWWWWWCIAMSSGRSRILWRGVKKGRVLPFHTLNNYFSFPVLSFPLSQPFTSISIPCFFIFPSFYALLLFFRSEAVPQILSAVKQTCRRNWFFLCGYLSNGSTSACNLLVSGVHAR